VEQNLYWVTDGTSQSAFLTTSDGVVLLDAPTGVLAAADVFTETTFWVMESSRLGLRYGSRVHP
jgi:hypothetical protein